jgi:hypothetical protein
VLAVGPAVLVNRQDAGTGAFSLSASSAAGIGTGTRLVRLRFRVVATSPAYGIVETATIEARSVSGEFQRSGRQILMIRIP